MIHTAVHNNVLAAETYPAEEFRTHLFEFWIPDWMISERIIFELPPFTDSDTRNHGIPYVIMPMFRWNEWRLYCEESDRECRSPNLPFPSVWLYSDMHQRYYDDDVFAHSKRRFPTEEGTEMVRATRLYAKAESDYPERLMMLKL